jgi:hypothetical protein
MGVWKRFTAWLERRQAEREALRYRRMMVLLTVSPGTLEDIKARLAEDEWTERRGAK